jgi:hypothetical protein
MFANKSGDILGIDIIICHTCYCCDICYFGHIVNKKGEFGDFLDALGGVLCVFVVDFPFPLDTRIQAK